MNLPIMNQSAMNQSARAALPYAGPADRPAVFLVLRRAAALVFGRAAVLVFRRAAALALGVCLLAAAGGAWAAVRAYPDRNPAPLDEAVTLTFEIDGDGGAPDFTPLRQDFEVLSRSRSRSLRLIDGRFSQSERWQVRLLAKRPGPVTVPAVSFGAERSRPFTLTVTAAERRAVREDDVFVEVQLSPRDPYVQAQALLTVRLFHAVEVNNASLSEPSLAGAPAVAVKLGDDRHDSVLRAGRQYHVVEQRYALFPQRSGKTTLDPIVFEGDVEGPGGLLTDPFNPLTTMSRTRVRSPAVNLTVRPEPPGAPAGVWLPAREVRVEEAWSRSPDALVAGEPVTRTLRVTAAGLSAGQLPPITAGASPDFKQYPEQPLLEDLKSESGVSGVREQKTALIPLRAGAFTLPPVEIAWWDTHTNRPRIARLPERTLQVGPGAAGADAAPAEPAANPSDSVTVAPSDPAAVAPPPATTAVPMAQPDAPAGPHRHPLWSALAAVFGIAALATLGAWLWRHVKTRPPRPARAVRQAFAGVEAACERADAPEAARALLRWAAARWPEAPPVSLGEIGRRLGGEPAAEIARLNRHLYGRGAEPWRPRVLCAALQAAARQRPPRAANAERELEPLYRG